jgi:integrase
MQLTPISSLGTTPKNPHAISSCRSKRLARPERIGQAPSYLYLRGSLYYFRYAFSDVEKAKIGRSEIRISLRTGYRREAQPLASALYTEIQHLMRVSRLDYLEIRKRMNEVLCRLLEQDSRDTSKRETYDLREHGLSVYTHADFARGHALVLQNMVNDPDFMEKYGPRMIAELVKSGFIDFEEITPDNYELILNEYTKIQQTYHKVVQHRLEGDYSFEAPIFAERAANQQVVARVVTPHAGEAKAEISVSEFIDKYVQTKIADGKWGKSGISTHENRLANLVDILGDVDVHSITREDMRGLREMLRQLPPNRQRSKKYKGKTVEEILALKPEKVLSVKTVNITLEAISSLFEWGIREGLVVHNPAKSLQVPDDRQDIELRDSFTREDLKVIFGSSKYAKDKFIKAAYFWIPLIALYTGMRREEVSQLHLSDVYQHDDGTWVFDVNLKPNKAGVVDKQLKNKSCIRLVPIHNDLIEIGFLEYCNRVEAAGHERVFPELNKTESSPKYGKQPGKQFCDLVKSLQLSSNKVFHSLRHSFDDAYKLREGHVSDVFKQVMAHVMQDLATKQYGSKFPPKQCYEEVISKIDYGLDLELLKSSRYARGGKNKKF